MTAHINVEQLNELGLVRRPPPEKKELGQEDFLELMTAQLQNQDPFKPMESGEFLSQIAQFAATRSIQEMQSTFTELAASLQAGQSLQASTLVGRDVLVESDQALFSGEAPVRGVVDVPVGAESMVMRITDGTGQVVRQVQLDVQGKGLQEFSWDGYRDNGELASPGLYNIELTTRIQGESVAATTLMYAPVDSVSIGGGQSGVTLNLAGVGSRLLSDVREIK